MDDFKVSLARAAGRIELVPAQVGMDTGGQVGGFLGGEGCPGGPG